MSKKLWEASIQQKKNSNLFKFEKFISKNLKKISSKLLKNFKMEHKKFTRFLEFILGFFTNKRNKRKEKNN